MTTVTRDNLEATRETMGASDQREELVVGCETWPISYEPGHQAGQMTRWPNGRGAVCKGGPSDWGNWDGGVLLLDERDDGNCIAVNVNGEEQSIE